MSVPTVIFDAPAAYFGSYGFFSLPPASYTVTLQDSLTGATGDGDYYVVFVCNELAVYGVSTTHPQVDGPAIHVVMRPTNNPIGVPYDIRVHKMHQYLVVNGSLVGTRDLRVLGGVNSTNIDPGVLSNAANNTSTGSAIQSVEALTPLGSTGGLTPVISINSPVPIADGGTGTATPALVPGENITITGPWPNQTISASGVGGTSSSGIATTTPTANGAYQLFALSTSQTAIPAMTADNVPAGYVTSASTVYNPGAAAFNAFNPAFNGWLNDSSALPQWIQIELPTAEAFVSYSIKPWSVDNFPTRTPTQWTMRGSNDGVNWTVLDTQTFSAWVINTASAPFVIASPTMFTFYRLNITANGGNSYTGIAQLTFNAPAVSKLYLMDPVGNISSILSTP